MRDLPTASFVFFVPFVVKQMFDEPGKLFFAQSRQER
jgi:hypothetical protein